MIQFIISIITIFNFPLPTRVEIMNVVMHDDAMLRYVLTIALIWPSSLATAELNDGQYIHKKIVPIMLNRSEL